MASITIRNLDERLKAKLRIQAARHGRSMEDEAREIMRRALADADRAPRDLAAAVRKRFETFGGVELETLPREPAREPPELDA